MNNLRIFLHGHNSSGSLYLGERWFKPSWEFISPSFMLGGAGYVLSSGAVDVLAGQLEDPRNDSQTGCRRSIPTSEEEPMLCNYLIRNFQITHSSLK